ncbi:MAG: hypothetical protein QOF89_6168 [Acidobacteriota bacterium]|jgi:hypothetical protein|nr:hypothetical protein [Acidobacteriota bacterium]
MHRAPVFVLLAVAAATLAPVPGFAASCAPTPTRFCLHDSRFAVEVAWTIPGGGSGAGHAVPLTNDTGLFWFFNDSNLELVVKVLDGRALNGHFWVYYGGLSDVEYTITVTDVRTGAFEVYHNPGSRLASGADVSAFAAEPAEAAGATAATAALPAGNVPLRQGSELPVNVTTQGMQRSPDVAIGPDGGSLVVWSGDTPLPAGGVRIDVYGRFYDAQGSPRGGERRLNEAQAGDQLRARVAAAQGGGFMAVWTNGSRVSGRAYGADGQPLGGEVVVSANAGPGQVLADVAADAGGFVVVWMEGGGFHSGQPSVIRGQRFDVHGGRVGGVLLVSGPADGTTRDEPRIAASPAGGFVAAWIEETGLGETDVMARRLDGAAQPLGAPFRVNAADDSSRVPGIHLGPVPIFHAGGGFSVLWTTFLFPNHAGNEGMFAHRYDPAGASLGGVVELRPGIGPQTPAAALLPSGDVLVLWEQWGPADPDGGIMARLFDGSWVPRGAEFRINTYTDRIQTEPALARDASGRLLAVWSSGVDYAAVLPPQGWGEGTQDGNFFGVFGQRFTTATCALTPDQLCLNGRFRVDVQLTNPLSGHLEAGHALPLTNDTGAFWFFGDSNLELLVKVLDGRALNGRFWVYAGALSDVDYTILITDTQTGKVKTYHNDQGRLASRADVEAF